MNFFLTLLTLLGCVFSSTLKDVDAKGYHEVIQKQNLTIIDFFSFSCPPCREFIPLIEDVAKKNPDVSFFKINIKGQDERILMGSLGIKIIPTLVFYKDGRELHRIVGRLSKSDLMKVVNKYKN